MNGGEEMRVRIKVFTLILGIVLFALLSFKGFATVIPPVIPEDHIYILNLWFVGVEPSTYGPLPVHVDIQNPDSVGHRYKVSVHLSGGYLFFGTQSETREGYVEGNSWASVDITLFPVLSGIRRFKLHLFQDGLHVDSRKLELNIAKSGFEQNLEDMSYQVSTLQTTLNNLNSETNRLNTELKASNVEISNLQMQLNLMYYMVIGSFVILITVVILLSVILYRRTRSIPAKKSSFRFLSDD